MGSIRTMTSELRTRGPDSSGTLNFKNRAFFGHTRLAILDLSKNGHQPIESDDWILVYNGEIYNHLELRPALEAQGVSFCGNSDTETLLQSIQRDGIDSTIQAINGIYAFAAYEKASGKLHLIRDRLGIKPLFYYQHNDRFWFASTPAAIANSAAASWDLDREALYYFFLLGGIYSDRTLFDGISRIDAAEHLIVSGAKIVSRRKYWQPQPREDDLEQTLAQATNQQQLSDVPISLFLSGGVDSSTLACLMPEASALHLDSDEFGYAKTVADHLGMPLTKVVPDMDTVTEMHRDYASINGEPSMAASMPMILSKEAQKLDYKVGLSTNGADELFYGYPRTPIPQNVATGLAGSSFSKCINQQVSHIFRHPENFSVPGFKSPMSFIEQVEDLEQRYRLENFPIHASYRWLELQSYVLFDLNPTLDYASMSHGIEMRVPFLDYKVVEAALSRPPEELVDPELGAKAPLKNVLDKHGIPKRVWDRPKMGFSLSAKHTEKLGSQRLQSIKDLKKNGHFVLHGRRGQLRRDTVYLGSSALAFQCWVDVWIKSGKVND